MGILQWSFEEALKKRLLEETEFTLNKQLLKFISEKSPSSAQKERAIF